MSVHRTRRTVLAAVGCVVLALAACTTEPPPSRPPTVPTLQSTEPGTPSVSPPSARPTPAIPFGEYTGPSPMPAADGGPMLWVAWKQHAFYDEGEWRQKDWFGFVDVTGNLVVPQRYTGYEYCRDANGRATLVLAMSPGRQVDVLDLTGAVVNRIPGDSARCLGDSHAFFHTTVKPESDPVTLGSGVFDLRTAKVVLPLEIESSPEILVTLENQETAHVKALESDEYFVDLQTGRKTPHPGSFYYSDYPSGPPWVATLGGYESFGYLDDSGRWALEPKFTSASPFRDGHAIISDETGSHFIDADFRRVGDEWDTIVPIERHYWTVGEGRYVVDTTSRVYQVTRTVNGAATTGILDKDLRMILDPVAADVTCQWDGEEVVCLILPETGSPRIARLPRGDAIGVPQGFTRLLSPTLLEHGEDSDGQTYVFNTTTGATFSTTTPASCDAVGEDWLHCERDVVQEVYTVSGQRTAFRNIHSIPDATTAWNGPSPTYYWAISGGYQGFVDASGRWLYRESRYTDLED